MNSQANDTKGDTVTGYSATTGEYGGWRDIPSRRRRWVRVLLALLILPTILLIVLGIYLVARFGGDTPVVYTDIEEHFKYGSTGGERESGIPYWIFLALPRVFPHHLPGPGGYASMGFIYEDGKDLPVGMSKRHHLGIDRTFLNCAVCHTSTVRDTPQSKSRLYLGMPANIFDVKAFQRFLFDCARDPKFSKKFIVPEVRRMMQAHGQDLDLIDRYIVYPAAIWIAREQLLTLSGRFAWAVNQYDWGPGRVDTFNVAKMLFYFPMDKMGEHEQNAPSDYPSIWYQGPRREMQLHWDGNNTMVEERNKSAAFGTGTTPPTIDVVAIGRLEKWLLTKEAPKYPYPIDQAKAAHGAGLYKKYCAACHGAGPRDFSGAYVGKVTPIEEIGTDRHRLDSYSYELAVNQSTLYAGYPWRFTHFRKTFGYANMPLDGIWLRAPYLHNGSVPTLRDLLEQSPQRPKVFYRGYDVYDPVKVGFRTDVAEEGARKYFKYDTAVPGNGNTGHEGERFGTELSAAEKETLVEFLKTF
jgi:cytochrome c2